jgi:hypothetical protein
VDVSIEYSVDVAEDVTAAYMVALVEIKKFADAVE